MGGRKGCPQVPGRRCSPQGLLLLPLPSPGTVWLFLRSPGSPFPLHPLRASFLPMLKAIQELPTFCAFQGVSHRCPPCQPLVRVPTDLGTSLGSRWLNAGVGCSLHPWPHVHPEFEISFQALQPWCCHGQEWRKAGGTAHREGQILGWQVSGAGGMDSSSLTPPGSSHRRG